MRAIAVAVICVSLGCGARTEIDPGAGMTDDAAVAGVLETSLLEASFSAGCMPVVPRDPTRTILRVRYTNRSTTGEATARVRDVRIHAADGAVVWRAAVAPDRVGVLAPGATVEIEHVSVPGSGSGPSHGCALCRKSYSIEVDLETSSGQRTLRTAPATMECTE